MIHDDWNSSVKFKEIICCVNSLSEVSNCNIPPLFVVQMRTNDNSWMQFLVNVILELICYKMYFNS